MKDTVYFIVCDRICVSATARRGLYTPGFFGEAVCGGWYSCQLHISGPVFLQTFDLISILCEDV